MLWKLEKKCLSLSPHLSHLKTSNFTSGWSETRGGGGLVPATSQAVTSVTNKNVHQHIFQAK